MKEWHRALALTLLAPFLLEPAERWVSQPVPPVKGGRLVLHDLKILSSTRGFAVGCLAQDRECRPVSLLTADGGKRWRLDAAPAAGHALFFLDESTGWMVSAGAVWKTSDSGATWESLPASVATRGASRVYFRDRQTGWAIGSSRGFSRTDDGGATWTPVEVGGGHPTSPVTTSYDWIAFANERFGMVAGASLAPRSGSEERGRELPHLTVFLDTRDGGDTWTASTTSMFGRVTRVAFEPNGRGLGLIEFRGEFEFPSEVFSIDWKTGRSSRVFRRKDIAITDAGFDAQGTAWLAGVQRSGAQSTGRVRVFRSADLSVWEEVATDRVSAARVMLALCCGESPWMATESGAFLRLTSK